MTKVKIMGFSLCRGCLENVEAQLLDIGLKINLCMCQIDRKLKDMIRKIFENKYATTCTTTGESVGRLNLKSKFSC